MSGRLQINTALTMVQEAAAAASQPVGSPGEPEQAAELNATTPRAHDNLDAAWSASPARPARQMARKYWQPDSEAFECAIAGCGTQFSSRNLFSGRHHCRACGRVVCAECSLGTRFMNPPRGEVGAPRQVRVCDACYGMGQTFDFQASPLPAHVRSLRRQHSDECLSAAADKCQQSKGHSRSLSSLRGLRHIASAPCLNSMVDSSGHGRTWPQPDNQLERASELSSSNPLSKAAKFQGEVVRGPKATEEVTLPKKISCKGMGPRRESQRSIAELAAQDEELAAKLKKLEANYTHSSFYQGLLEYEPHALKALLMSEVSMQKHEHSLTRTRSNEALETDS